MMRVVAHRGASRRFPENSQRAFKEAFNIGADSLEVDLRRSADGKIYCFHDQNLSRVTGERGVFEKTSSGVIDKLSLFSNEPILSFQSFLECFGGKIRIVLDIKSVGIESDILQLVSKYGNGGEFIFSSFELEIIRKIKSLDSQVQTALIVGPLRNLRPKLDPARSLINKLKTSQCTAIHLSRHIAPGRMISRFLKAGFEVAIWTVDQRNAANKFTRLGAREIITNVPETMVNPAPSDINNVTLKSEVD